MNTKEMNPEMISKDEDDDSFFLETLQYVHGSLFSMAVSAAIELDIFGIIARAAPTPQLSATEIASHFPQKNPNTASCLDQLLRLLVTRSFLTCSARTLDDGSSVERIYGLAPLAAKYLAPASDHMASLAPMFSLGTHKAVINIWSHMKDVLIEGGDQFRKRNGMPTYELMAKDPRFNEIFDGAMAGVTNITMAKILKVYKGFEGLTSLADVGGGNGRLLRMVVSMYPSIKGINFDLARVIKTAPPYPGIEHVEGDMFVSVPKADAIVLKYVLHNWNDELCLKILKNCYEALPENGKAVIIDLIPPEVPDSSLASIYLAETDCIQVLHGSGRERTLKELEALCMASAFSDFHVACSVYDAWTVVEFRK